MSKVWIAAQQTPSDSRDMCYYVIQTSHLRLKNSDIRSFNLQINIPVGSLLSLVELVLLVNGSLPRAMSAFMTGIRLRNFLERKKSLSLLKSKRTRSSHSPPTNQKFIWEKE